MLSMADHQRGKQIHSSRLLPTPARKRYSIVGVDRSPLVTETGAKSTLSSVVLSV